LFLTSKSYYFVPRKFPLLDLALLWFLNRKLTGWRNSFTWRDVYFGTSHKGRSPPALVFYLLQAQRDSCVASCSSNFVTGVSNVFPAFCVALAALFERPPRTIFLREGDLGDASGVA
jgi:hypothetical protein